MGRKLDILLGMLLVVTAVVCLSLTASGNLPPGGYLPSIDLDAMTTQEFLQYASLDLNTATQEELMELYGIGEVLSQRIVASRETEGPYGSVEDLLRVKGIGPARLEMVRPYVYAG